jgi:hypothetical protein
MAVLMIIVLVTGQVFSVEPTVKPPAGKRNVSFSVGGGGIFTMDFTNYVGVDAVSGASDAAKWDHTLTGGGATLFFDAAYAEATVGVVFGENI